MTSTNALTLNGTGIGGNGALINSSTTAGTYAGLITLGSASSIVTTSGNIAISNAGTIAGGYGLTLGGTQTGTITSILGTGVSSVTENGTGTWTLSGANTYTGATTVSSGTLKAGVATTGGVAPTKGAFGVNSAVTVYSGATLDLNGLAETIGSLSDNAGSGGTVTSSAAGAITLIIGGSNTTTSFAGTIQNGSGTVSVDENRGDGHPDLGGRQHLHRRHDNLRWDIKGRQRDGPGRKRRAVSVTAGAALDLNGTTMTNTNNLTVNGTGVGSNGSLINEQHNRGHLRRCDHPRRSRQPRGHQWQSRPLQRRHHSGRGVTLTFGGTATGSIFTSILGIAGTTLTITGLGGPGCRPAQFFHLVPTTNFRRDIKARHCNTPSNRLRLVIRGPHSI